MFSCRTNSRDSVSGHRLECHFEKVDEAIAMATMYTANHLDINTICVPNRSTPLWMSRIRTGIQFGLSRRKYSLGRMALYRGVYPIAFAFDKCTRDNINIKAVETLCAHHPLENGQLVILTKGDFIDVWKFECNENFEIGDVHEYYAEYYFVLGV